VACQGTAEFLLDRRGSAFECVPLLELCKREKLITEDTWADLKAELEVLSKMLTALINSTDKRRE
jgi:four helix bundle protein